MSFYSSYYSGLSYSHGGLGCGYGGYGYALYCPYCYGRFWPSGFF
ncbi:keratin-associated protein 22-1-like [Canis lupus familiaris]|uniref:Uncharacterized protein n=1 Tax=Canis lupus familiaris TaxID=9615 RepID=A0A8C0RJN7_CANLF|nr:keratin-associated protein 22-1-like [Canis lupus familiaris]XP_025305810.1 keratin-associated protein 22-1-like [Canis lupus dingo]XP_038437061.1 keratin-associated protein 22-1-like [Canis lupus familiaris]|eukprot:XP_022269074.1 keratin-associated protein 22-1-like [Canis lupus familiaris]